MKKEKKPKSKGQSWIAVLLSLLLGGCAGVLILNYLIPLGKGLSLGQRLLLFALSLFSFYVAMLLQIIIHEAGHLVFGLLTGYRFLSFRVFSLMLVRVDGKLRFRRYSLAGTGGQCLMIPPPLRDGTMPVLLYNFGGAILNLVTSALFFALSLLLPPSSFLRLFLRLLALVGVYYALTNGIPLHLGPVDNDGSNALSLLRSREAVQAFWIQLKVNEQIAKGVRTKDMPADWFALPSEEELQRSSLSVAIGVLAANRLMDQHRFAEADALMERLLGMESRLPGLYRGQLTCDRVFVELIGPNRPEILEGFLSKEQQKLMKAMKTNLSVLRTAYALALLSEKDAAKAQRLAADFDRVAARCPYPCEVEGERELLQLAREAAARSNVNTRSIV